MIGNTRISKFQHEVMSFLSISTFFDLCLFFIHAYHYFFLKKKKKGQNKLIHIAIREKVLSTVVLFRNLSLNTDGSKSAQPPRSQFVNLRDFTSNFLLPWIFKKKEFCSNAIKIDNILIIINIIIIILLTILKTIQNKK